MSFPERPISIRRQQPPAIGSDRGLSGGGGGGGFVSEAYCLWVTVSSLGVGRNGEAGFLLMGNFKNVFYV